MADAGHGYPDAGHPGDHGAIVPRDQSKEEQEQSALFVATQSSAPLAEIVGISFGLLNPAHARANAVDIITKPTINSKGKPPLAVSIHQHLVRSTTTR